MKHFFIFFIAFISNRAISQCSFVPLVNNDYNLPGYRSSSYVCADRDTSGKIFVGSISQQTLAVHMYDGSNWQKLGAISNVSVFLSSSFKIAVSKNGTPYIAFVENSNFFLTVMSYSAGVWNYVGTAGCSSIAVGSYDIKVNSSDQPVIAFSSASGGSVMNYNGTSWSSITAQPITTVSLSYLSLALNSADVPYVGYSDGTGWPGLRATVKMFNGSAWVLVGPQQFSAGQASWVNLKFDKNNNLFIGYSDGFYSNRVTVKRFISPNWVTVGLPGFTSNQSTFTTMALDTNGTPYIGAEVYAPSPPANATRAKVMMYNGTNWVYVGLNGVVSDEDAYYTSLVIAKDNLPALAYVDLDRESKPALKKFNGSTWNFVGDKGFSILASNLNTNNSAIDKYGTYYTCFSDAANGNRASVMKYTAGAWSYVGLPAFSPGAASALRLRFDTANNVPYVCFADGAANQLQSVMKYNGTAWVYVGTAGFSAQQVSNDHMAFYNNVPYVVSMNSTTGYRQIYSFNGTSWNDYGGLNGGNGYNSGGSTFNPKICFDNTGALYLLNAAASAIDVGKYDGSSWQSLSPLSLGSGFNSDMYVTASGTPYVIYSDLSSAQRVTVQKYNGSSWISLGNAGFSAGQSVSNSIIGLNGILYIAYADLSQQQRVKFSRFNGTSWVDGCSDSFITAGTSTDVNLEKDTLGNVYLLFKSTESYAKQLDLTSPLMITGPSFICNGETATLTVSGAPSYTWNTLATTSSISVSPTVNTSYFVDSYNTSNCFVSFVKAIEVKAVPNVTLSGPASICSGKSATLLATGATSYTWNNSVSSSSFVVFPTATTIYTAFGTGTTGCIATRTLQINVFASPTISLSLSSNTICQNNPITITASGAQNYSLATLSYTFAMNTNVQVQNPLATTVFTVTGINANGCVDTEVATVIVNPIPYIFILASSTLICAGESVTLQASGANSYTWNVATNGSVTSSLCIQSPPSNMTYSVNASSAAGCVGSAFKTIGVQALPVVSILASNTLVCSGSEITLTASGAEDFTWFPGAMNLTTITNPIFTTTTFTAQGYSSGCFNNAIITIETSLCTATHPEFNMEAEVKVYPNPSTGLYKIEYDGQINKINVVNVTGQTLLLLENIRPSQEINLSDYDNGIYFITIQFKSGSNRVIKLVKE